MDGAALLLLHAGAGSLQHVFVLLVFELAHARAHDAAPLRHFLLAQQPAL